MNRAVLRGSQKKGGRTGRCQGTTCKPIAQSCSTLPLALVWEFYRTILSGKPPQEMGLSPRTLISSSAEQAEEVLGAVPGKPWMCPTCGRFGSRLTCASTEHARRYEMYLRRRRRNYDKIRLQVIKALGGACKNCGITDIRLLQINHRKGGGTKDFGRDPVKAYRDIMRSRRDRTEFDIRCANCNILYEYERKTRGVLVR